MSNLPLVNQTIAWLETLATQVPATWFVFIGSFAEEIFSPIPSPLVLTLAGSVAASQSRGLIYLVTLALIGAAGKTIASWIFYILADKFEDLFSGKLGKFFGADKNQIEKVGQVLNRYKQKTLILTLIRTFPASPSLPVSLLCGFIKLNLKSYLISTYFGYALRNIFYLYIGYAGLTSIKGRLDNTEDFLKIGFVIATLAIIVFLYYQRSKGKTLTDVLEDHTEKHNN